MIRDPESAVAAYVARLERAGRRRTATEYRRYLARWLASGETPESFLAGLTPASRVPAAAALRGFVGFCVATDRVSVKQATKMIRGWRV
jgi:hypothetical protein